MIYVREAVNKDGRTLRDVSSLSDAVLADWVVASLLGSADLHLRTFRAMTAQIGVRLRFPISVPPNDQTPSANGGPEEPLLSTLGPERTRKMPYIPAPDHVE